MTSDEAPSPTPTQKGTAITMACLIEGCLLFLIILAKPDPPLDIIDVILLASQLPGVIIAMMFGSGMGGGAVLFILLFLFQTPFYYLLISRFFKPDEATE